MRAQFKFYGNGNWVAGIKGNSVKGRQTGSNCIHFSSDGATVEYELPGLQVKGERGGQGRAEARRGATCTYHTGAPAVR